RRNHRDRPVRVALRPSGLREQQESAGPAQHHSHAVWCSGISREANRNTRFVAPIKRDAPVGVNAAEAAPCSLIKSTTRCVLFPYPRRASESDSAKALSA